ncbi:MAG TPA: cyclopropane-fatty-acyl-phospholipid synthase family protein [Mycobacteriales bacterium]|nr:cyclopropane-fatty-acyl-phospholipid synthase family protein [Mycobacteriales bacterium]
MTARPASPTSGPATVAAPSDVAIDLERWPGLAPPSNAPLHAEAARRLVRRAARLAEIRVEFPEGSSWGPDTAPAIVLRDPDALFTRLGRDVLIGFGESFMAAEWDSDALVDVLARLAGRVDRLVPRPLQRLRSWVEAHRPPAEDNDQDGARRNIARHYDLSNEMFALFLDETLTYSSALFETPDEPLVDGQRRKVQRILDIAGVTTGSRVLEIGTGWGELAIQAAHRGAQVTTLTLSVEQAELARQRIAAAGVSDRIDLRVQDYRDVTGEFDAIVSVEMIEAVGERWWPTYFRAIDALLAPGGRVGLQAIVMPHDRLLASRRSWTWIHKYIFPGGLLLSEQAIDEVCAKHTALRVVDRLHLGSSYAETLRAWRERFTANREAIAALGFDDVFQRMWTFYLSYCEGGFRAGYLDDVQLTLTRG